MRKARAAMRNADILEVEGDATARTTQLGEARTLLRKAGDLLKKAVEEQEDTADGERQDDEGGQNTGALDKALHQLKSLDARLTRFEGGHHKPTSKSDSSVSAVLSVPQFLDVVAGASATGISMPPDFSKAVTPSESVETRVIRALDEGGLTGADAATAESMLAMWNVARRGGDVTVDQFMDRLASKGVPQSVRDLWNVRSIPARLSMH
jgi:hypothetical protein